MTVVSQIASFKFLSTPSARRATATTGSSLSRIGHFYPRPPRGGRPSSALCSCCHALFLSTPSARRATARRYAHGLGSAISIHALREEGDDAQSGGKDMGFISIHALREEGDRCDDVHLKERYIFLSTPSARRATGMA